MGITSNSEGKANGPVSSAISLSGEGDFVSVIRPTRQANILIYGEEKTGKTTFCTRYAPDPIRVLSLDGRAQDAVYEAVNEYGRDVKLAELFMPDGYRTDTESERNETKSIARNLLERIHQNFEIAINNPSVRCILVDTLKELEEISKLALDGTMEKVKEHSHGEPGDYANRQVWKMANLARRKKNTHVIFTARATEIWEDQKPTGRFKPQCPKAGKAAVDWAGQIRLVKSFGQAKPKFEIEITSAGTNNEELLEVYTEDKWNLLGGPFVYACVQNYKDSIPDDWK